jgi:phosphoribosylaminoimidazole carboxylase (NCAIR synthetase)
VLTSYLRIGAALAILAGLALSAVLMLPPYFRNLEFQRRLEQLAQQSDVATQPAEVVRTQALNAAAELGLPVRSDQVAVERAGERYRLRVLYVRRVDLLIYTVDLHFRSSTGN